MNGLLTYDRIPKVDPAKIAQANRFELPLPKYVPVVPTSEASPQMWRFTTKSPGKEWNQTSFEDSAWMEKRGGFGNVTDRAGTEWTTQGIWARRHFNPGKLSPAQLENWSRMICIWAMSKSLSMVSWPIRKGETACRMSIVA
jgi:hypothetical protein